MSLDVALLGGSSGASQKDLNHAWGLHHSSAKRVLLSLLAGGGVAGRSERSDKGKSMIADEQFANKRITVEATYKKNMLSGDVVSGVGRKYSHQQLKEMFKQLTTDQLKEVQLQNVQDKNDILNAEREIIDLLRRSNRRK